MKAILTFVFVMFFTIKVLAGNGDIIPTKWDHVDTFKKYIFNEKCFVRNEDLPTVKSISDSITSYTASHNTNYVLITIVKDSSYYSPKERYSPCDFRNSSSLANQIEKINPAVNGNSTEPAYRHGVVYRNKIYANYSTPSIILVQYRNK